MMGSEGRGLDHLMEQNDTELAFLSAYGGVDDAVSYTHLTLPTTG